VTGHVRVTDMFFVLIGVTIFHLHAVVKTHKTESQKFELT
jgi:hypothetical protein